MKYLALCLSLLFVAAPLAVAQSADDQYLRIYSLIQSAEALETSGQKSAALARYREAQTALQSFQKVYPDWNPKVVTFRINYVSAKVDLNAAAIPSTVPRTNAPASQPTPTPVAPPVTPDPVTELRQQMNALQENVRQLQDDKVLLEAKLREALSAQPAATDPRELAKAQQQVRELQRENELLKAAADPAVTNSGVNEKALQELRDTLAETNRKLTTQTELAKNLTGENESLQERLKSLATSPAALEALRAENEILKKQLADNKTAGASDAERARKLEEAQARIVALQSDSEVLRLEKIALENRVKTLVAQQSTAPAVVARPEDLEKIKRLESERDDYAKKLTEATKELSSRRGRAANARIEQLNTQIDTLRTRVQVFEARAVPYTAEELALFEKPKSQLAAAASGGKPDKKPASQLPAGVADLVASAQRHFSAREFDQAEKEYLEILRRDENNVYTLANLAAIQLERGNLTEAEKNAAKAVAGAPEDDYSLTILGQIKFRQELHDEALDAFNRAAKVKPQSAELQNYLGVVLGHKGLRDPAEQALRRAIVLNPGYADAHYNLAVLYGTKDSSFLNLAKWHYQRATSGGHPRNADLEKLFESKTSTVESK